MNDETREEVGPNAMGNVLSSASAAVAATAVPLQKPPHSTITPPLWQPTPCTAPLDRFGSLAGLVASFALLQQKKKKKSEEKTRRTKIATAAAVAAFAATTYALTFYYVGICFLFFVFSYFASRFCRGVSLTFSN